MKICLILRLIRLKTIILCIFFLFFLQSNASGKEYSEAYVDFLSTIGTFSSPWKAIDYCDSTLASGLLARSEIGLVHGYIGALSFQAAMTMIQEMESTGALDRKKNMIIGTLLKECIQHYNIAIAIDPNFYKNYWNQGFAYEVSGKLNNALENYNKTIEKEPNFAKGYIYRARVLILTGKIDDAKADIETAFRLEPENPEIIIHINHLKKLVNDGKR